MKESADLHEHPHNVNRFAVIPTAVRLHADPYKTGKGVTIAFLDAGFFPHPDLMKPENRIVAYHDVTDPDSQLSPDNQPQSWDWHGTQTSVAAAGNGFLSDGIYRGLACKANVVLVKVSEQGKITEKNIARGLEWVLQNRAYYNIRVVSISLGGDADVPYSENPVDQLAEEAVRQGLVLVVAAGNSGCTDHPIPVPPANAPSVITVGGYDDENMPDNAKPGLYCSSFGPTSDGFVKPEVLAPAMWVAAPILPLTDLYAKAEALTHLAASPDYALPALAAKLNTICGFPQTVLSQNSQVIRSAVESMLRENKIISAHYQHVDGTSFAAPVVASIVGQMLEANPQLTPSAAKNILISTAQRIHNAPIFRQGYGVINAKSAVDQAMHEQHLDHDHFSPPRIESDNLLFFYHDDSAVSVAVAGDFNDWNPTSLSKEISGIWRVKIAIPQAGRYRYKFIVNGDLWVDDPSNGLKEPDNYGGFNSIITLM